MSSVPSECQELAGRVESLQAAEASARDAIVGLVGAEAWIALTALARVRGELADARFALSTCVAHHLGSLEMRFIVIDAGPPRLPTGRVAHLYEPGQFTPTAESALAGDVFLFDGPLPPRFAIIVWSQGIPEAIGTDFRTGVIEASTLPAPAAIRAEVVLGPEVGFSSADVARWASAIPLPIQTELASSVSGISARVDLLTIEATLATGLINVHAGGQIDWSGPGLSAPATPFTTTLTLVFALPPTPTTVEPCHISLASGPNVDIPGIPGAFVAVGLPLVRDSLEGMLMEQLRKAVLRGFQAIVARAFGLTELPAGVTVSIRRLEVQTDTVKFEPAIGAMGTTLSTFHPPPSLSPFE